MKDTLRKLKRKRYVTSILIVMLLVFVVGLISILKPVIKNINIKNVLSKTTSLNASVIDGVSENVSSNNYDEIKYQLKVNKDSDDEAVITGTLTDKENKYARFKEIKDAIVSDNGKKITLTTKRNKVTITVIVSNAPYGTTINPKFKINSEDETKSKIDVDPVTITGKSVEGKIYDENGTYYTGLELSLNNSEGEVKRTYTRDNGEYVFSLGDVDTYEVKLEEEKYQIVRYTEETTDENRRVLNIVIREVEPFNLEIKKTISKLDLVINGKKETYNYDDETKVVRSIKNAKTIEGSIYYNIGIKNTGEIKGTLTVLKDRIPEGLSFDESKNPGWTKNGKYIYYTVVEGKEIEPFGKLNATLILDIIKTNEAKTYINTAMASGEDYKYVAYYLNNKLFREEYVISSEKIEDIDPHVENFDGWYTDKEFNNKYNFNNQVLKDIVLFGKISNKKYNVTFMDINPNTNEETILDIKEVEEGTPVSVVDTPSYNGYTFKCFTLNDECYNSEEINEDVTLYTKYTVNQYNITYNLDHGTLDEENPSVYTVKYEITLNNPKKEGYTFIGWTGTGLSELTLNVTIPTGSTGDREYTANYEINKSTLTVDPNGGTYLDNSSSVLYTKDYGTIMQIADSVRRGYTFRKYNKTGGGLFSNGTYTFDNDDATLTAEYGINTYEITYQGLTDEELEVLNNPKTFNVETETFTLNEPGTRYDASGNKLQDFLGWDDGSGNVSINVTIPQGSIDDRTYTAVWKENEDVYTITYYTNGGTTSGQNPTKYTRQSNTFTLYNPSKVGYNFTGWSGTGIDGLSTLVIVEKGSAGARTYTANYEIIPYTITYENITDDERATLNNPTGYNVETETFTLSEPETRYDAGGNKLQDFLGWDDGNGNVSKNVTITKGSTGNRTYTAVWKENDDSYSITYNLDGGTPTEPNPTTYTRKTETFTLHVPVKDGYIFTGWSGTDLIGDTNIIVTIPKGSAGAREYTAHYQAESYTITYNGLTNVEKALLGNPTSYTVETETFTLTNPTSRLDNKGYSIEDFVGWDDGNGNVSKNITITKGSSGNRTYTAKWVDNVDEYSITYSLDNGTPSEPNPSTYTRATETFTLHNPSKTGYRFLGWSGTDILGLSTSVTIPKGSAGDRLYYAYYQAIPYTISYNGLTEEEINAINNPSSYDVETNTFTLANPTREGYEFDGWTGTGITNKSTSVTIPKGSTGNRVYTAHFKKLEYSLTYTYNGGTPEEENPSKYSIDSAPITLHNPSKAGYTFLGWSGTDLDGNKNTVVTIPTGSTGHRSFLANYNPITYNITYDYNGGELEEGYTNPSTYTIESDPITFATPVKEGYIFTNYTFNGIIMTNIPTGTMGDIDLVANYEIRKYDINYHNENTLYHTEQVNWSTTANKPSTDPTKAHHIFLYWSEDGINEYDFSTIITADKDLYAVYEEVIAPEISISPTLDEETNKTWVCGDSSNSDCGVTVTISSEHSDYELYYKVGNGPATLYTEPFKVYENTEVTAWSKKNNINSESVEEDIVNVDTIAPTINEPLSGAMSFNMSVSGTAQDASSGIKKFTLYAKEKTALVFDDNFTYTTDDFDGLKDHAENYDHTFYGVQDNTEYIVKIVAEDYVGNISEIEVEVKTKPYVARVVGKNGMLWYTVDPDTKEMIVDADKEFLLFDSIQSAVNYCANVQCTIQTNPTQPVINESVTVAANQDITIDLDGRGIVSTETATFTNNGKLQIVDRNPRNDDSIGFVNNTVNKAIVNNNILVIGDGSSEPSEIFINPELDRPIIYGKVTGIEQNKEFHFYDGKIKSDSLAITDNGDDVITQYSYNVVITEEDDLNVATMARVTDPEARIRSTYYQKLNVKDGGDAFDTSNSGTITKESAKLLSKIKQVGDYGFIYDEVNDEIYSGNTSTYNTTALSYIKIDLTKYDSDQIITFDTFADTSGTSSYGYVSISEEFGNQGTIIYKTTGNDYVGTKIYQLPKGKVYYMYFGFVKGHNDVIKYEIFKVTSLNLIGERQANSSFTMYNDGDYYPFEKQNDGSYVSTNKGINNSYSHSYTMLDTRSINDDLMVIVDYSIESENSDIGYIYLTDDANFQNCNVTDNQILYVFGTSNGKTHFVLPAGTIKYLHFGYGKDRNTHVGADEFRINSMTFTSVNSDYVVSPSSFEHGDGDAYYFEPFNSITDLSGTYHDTIYGAIIDSENNGFVFNGSNNISIYNGITANTLTSETVELEFSTTSISDSLYYMGSNKEKIAIGLWSGQLIVSNSSRTSRYILPTEWTDGNKHKVLVTDNGGTYNAYFDNVLMTKSSSNDGFSGANANTYIGARSNGNNFTGTIYKVKVYNRALSEEEITGTASTEGLILHLDASNPQLRQVGYINNNIKIGNTAAHSYVKYDLTNVNEDKYLYINTDISSEKNYDFGYVQITNSPNYPSDTTGAIMTVSGDYTDQNKIIKLQKNNEYYVHFMYTKDGGTNSGRDSFVIKNIDLLDTIEDAYSMNKNNYSKTDTMYFEKPVINQKVETIEMLKDITLDIPIVIPQEQEVILDLNGFSLTSSVNDYIIKNNGKLTIKDSAYEELKDINVDYATAQSELFEAAKEQYLVDLTEYQEYAGLCDGCTPSEEYKIDNTATKIYSYEDSAQEYKAYLSGDYKVELWGASGATNDIGGKGAYTSGIITLNEGDKLYVYTGEQSSGFNATYNGGGGCTNNCTAGGGATDVRLVAGSWNDATSLSSRIMVAAGGAGYNVWQNGYVGGAGGALTGINGAGDSPTTVATQTSGAISYGNVQNMNGTFGIGGYGDNWGGGGSGGYWGGAGGKNSSTGNGGSSGSSYISGYLGSVAIRTEDDLSPRLINNNTIQCTDEIASENVECSYHYSGKIFTDGVMKSGAEEMPNYNDDTTMVGNLGNGYARISYNVPPEELEEMRNNLEKTYTVKEEPKFIDYLDGIDFDGTVNINQLTPESTPSYRKTVEEVRNGKIVSTIANIILNEEYAKLTLESGEIYLNVNSKIAIENRGSLVINDAIINVNNSSTIGVFNETNGSIAFTGNGGSINAVGSSSTGLLNRSNTPAISNAKVTTTPTNAVGIKNEAIGDIAFDNMNLSGAGVAFSEHSTGNTIINNSNLKSTGNSSLISYPQGAQSKLQITNSNFSGQLTVYDSRKKVEITNSSLTTLLNSYGDVKIYESNLASINNSGDTVIDKSVITGSGTVITNSANGSSNYAYTRKSARTSRMLLTNSTINSTANKNTSVTVMSNMDTMTIKDTVINNINQNTSATAITNDHLWIGNDSNFEFNSYLNISGNITIDSTFGTAINNTGVVTLGSKINNISTEYDYAYTGHQEEFVAPVTGEYKLETWGAGGIGSGLQIMLGGPGGYASGTISLNEGDKLYIHVGGVGSIGMAADYLIGNTRDYHSGSQGSYNGGSPIVWRNSEAIYGAGGGATDISLSNEDNTWSYDNGILTSTRSAASYNQRILVAGGGSGCENSTSCAGGYNVDPSTSRLGYGTNSGGGGYYGGTYNIGGSSYASSALSNVLLLDGNKEIPDYNSVSGIIKGSRGNGYARITLLDDSPDTVISSPNITATNYGITGNGKLYFYDGTIEANVAVNATIDEVTDDYDIYVKHGTKETMTLVANENSRPVEEGQEEFACKIGNAKYTTINNALEASNNGDIIELLVNIEQQNQIVIPQNKIITIDYKGHTVKSYNPEALYKNYGNLTITDSTNALNKNTFTGKEYIYNEGTLALSRVYLYNNAKNTYIIENNDGIVTMDSVKIDVGADNSDGKVGINNSANGVVTAQNSTFSMWYNNKMFNNYGTLEVKNSTVNNHLWTANHFYNNATGTLVLDGNTFTVDGHGGNGRGFLTNAGTATIKNMTTNIEKISNTGKLILEGNNNIPSGILDSTGLVIVNAGTYKNTFNINNGGKSIDDTEDLYSFIMNDGTINTTLNINTTKITSIKGGTISVTSGYAINNTAAGTINLGIKDGTVLNKDNTKPVITGKTYGIYTSVPALVVNFYDGIISGNKAYNVTIREVETGYSVHRDYDDTNNIETKYLTNEVMFTNTTHPAEYNSISELNTALSNGSIVDDDVIQVYRDITITNNDNAITIPNGLKITFDINGKIVDKNNNTMFIVNGELDAVDTVISSTGKIDSTVGDIFSNNGTINALSGTYISEKANVESTVFKNNSTGTLNVIGGTFTKYYDSLGYRSFNSGSIIDNYGNTVVTGGDFYANSSLTLYYYSKSGIPDKGANAISGVNYLYSSAVFMNEQSGTLNVTGGNFDGITGKTWNDLNVAWSDPSWDNKGELIYNYGTATIKGITSYNTHIGRNDGTLTLDTVVMPNIYQMQAQFGHGGTFPNLINKGDIYLKNSEFTVLAQFAENYGNMYITDTIIDRTGNSSYYNATLPDSWQQGSGHKNSHVIRNYYNSLSDNILSISDSYIYNKGSGEVIDNRGKVDIEDSTLEASNNTVITNTSAILNVKGDSSVITQNGNYSGVTLTSSSTFTIGEPIEIDGAVSQTKPLIKGITYGVSNSSSTFNFYDGLIEGKTLAFNGTFSSLESGYTVMYDTDGDYKSNYLDRIPIIQNVTQATASDEKKYYDLKTAFEEANDNDTLKMIADYSSLPTDETAVNDHIVTFDLNGKVLRQSNNVLIQNNGTLNVTDDSQNADGNLIFLSGTNVLRNDGTLNIIGGKISTAKADVTLIKNNSGATLNIRDNAKITSSTNTYLIDNSGTTNITNGAYLHTIERNIIINRSILNVIDLNNDDDENTSSDLRAPIMNDEAGRGYGTRYYHHGIYSTSNSTTTIYGGIFNNGETYGTGSPSTSIIIYNEGTATIKNLESYAGLIGDNTGTLTIEKSHFYNSYWRMIINSGTLRFDDVEIEITDNTNQGRISTAGTAIFNNVRIKGRNENTTYGGPLLDSYGNLSIENSSINVKLSDEMMYNTSTLNIKDTTINGNYGIYNRGNLTLDHTSITTSDYVISSETSGTINVKNISTLHSTNANAVALRGSTKLNVIGENTIISDNGIGISLADSTTLNIGEIGGTPDTDTPYIEGTTYGVYNGSLTTTLNFYDGRVVGRTGPNAIYGVLNNVEAEFEPTTVLITDPDTNIGKYNEYLVRSANSVIVAKVGNYSFASVGSISPSRALQNAINFAIGDGSNVKDVDLTSVDIDLVTDEYSITASMPVTINLNNHTINQNSTYNLSSNITLNNNTGVGASISKLLGNVFSTGNSSKDIVIYELSDGSKLDTTKIYKLYKDDKVISLEKEELGRYKYKGDTEELTSVKGRLYLDNLSEGSYRLVSNDNKSIEFSIDSDGKITGNVTESTRNSSETSAVANSEAELILQIQTGKDKNYYWLLIIPIVFIIGLLIIANKNKKRES